jgi:SAM-dependent methyltransferase
MHPLLRKAAESAGFHESDGSILILTCGAEDSVSILSALENQQVDTIISVLTLCSVPNPEKTVHNLVRDVLKSGGKFLFYEHVLSPREDVAWWQRFWAPVWQVAFDGCRMDRPSHLFFDRLQVDVDGTKSSPWKEARLWGKPEEPEEHLFWHQVGRFVKK